MFSVKILITLTLFFWPNLHALPIAWPSTALTSSYFELIGFSGHHHGIAVDIAAYTLGANWFERHFTLDRTWKGTDQVFSLEPTGIRKLARDLRATKLALTYKKTEILDIEKTKGGYEKFKSEWVL